MSITEKWRLRKLGAHNAMAAYAMYAGKVPPLSMQVLAFMALVSKDSDAEPWWSQGHAVLAEMAMGREPLRLTGDEKADARAEKAMRAAVERAVTPLFQAGAIAVDRHSSGGRGGGKGQHVRYRLHLNRPAAPVDNPETPHGIRGVDNPSEELNAPRNPWGETEKHPTVSVETPHGFRGKHPTDSVGLRRTEEPRGANKEQEPSHPSSQPEPSPAREGVDGSKLVGAGRPGAIARWASPQDIAARQLAESRAMREGRPP